MSRVDEVVRTLETNWLAFRKEADQLARSEWTAWPVRAAYQGEWLLFPFISNELASCMHVNFDANRRRCPESYRLLSKLPGLLEAGFSRLEPGTHIYPHAEEVESAHLRCHLGLRIPPRAAIRIDGERMGWQEGRCLVFDGHSMHEAANLDSVARTILLCDFDPDAAA